jgi:hypothetical protein
MEANCPLCFTVRFTCIKRRNITHFAPLLAVGDTCGFLASAVFVAGLPPSATSVDTRLVRPGLDPAAVNIYSVYCIFFPLHSKLLSDLDFPIDQTTVINLTTHIRSLAKR